MSGFSSWQSSRKRVFNVFLGYNGTNLSPGAELLLKISITLSVLEGAVRKWLVDDDITFKYLAYFSKDLVFVFLAFILAKGISGATLQLMRKYFTAGLILILVGSLASTMGGFNVVGAILTIRSLIVLPMACYWAAHCLKGCKLESILRLIGWLCVVNAVLSTIQFYLPADDILNRYSASSDIISGFRENVRATGTFSYISGLARFSLFGTWAGLCIIILSHGYYETIFGILTTISSMVCAFTSISRGAVLLDLGLIVMTLIATRAILKNLPLVLLGGGICGLLFYENAPIEDLPSLSTAVLLRHQESGEEITDRLIGPVSDLGSAIVTAPFGSGFGCQQIAGVYAETGQLRFSAYESQWARIVLECGVLGLIGTFICQGGIIYTLIVSVRNLGTSRLSMVLVMGMVVILMFHLTNTAFDHVASSFVWSISAVLLACAERALEERNDVDRSSFKMEVARSRLKTPSIQQRPVL